MDGPANRSRGVDIDETEKDGVAKGDAPLGADIEFEVSGIAAVEVVPWMGVEAPIDCPGKIRLVLRVPCMRGPESCCTDGLGLVIDGYPDRDAVSGNNRGGNPDIQVMS